MEGLDFDKTFALVTLLEFVWLLVSIACTEQLTLQQIDVKSAFLNGILQEEAYIEQLKGFISSEHLDYVDRQKKALYGLK